MSCDTAVLLIAHGSRNPAANEDLAELANRVAERRSFVAVEIAYLELATPTIRDGARACVAHGAKRVLMLPYFLSAGVHVEQDLEQHRQELTREFPGVRFVLCPPLGLHPLMVEVVLDRLDEGDDRTQRGEEAKSTQKFGQEKGEGAEHS